MRSNVLQKMMVYLSLISCSMSESHPHEDQEVWKRACLSRSGIPMPHSLSFKASASTKPLVAFNMFIRLGFWLNFSDTPLKQMSYPRSRHSSLFIPFI